MEIPDTESNDSTIYPDSYGVPGIIYHVKYIAQFN